MLTLINGDGNPRVTAAQDADWYGSLTGEKTCIMPANDKFSATVADANTIEISSGVLITKEGRRVQVDAETIEEIIIPTGTQGVDTYYIIGFHLYIDESGQQVAETFVETMENESDTITETTFREGSTSIYISLYRVKRSGLTLESVTRICPMYELSADEIVYGNTDVGAELTQINQGLSAINSDLSLNTTTQTFSNDQFSITATTKYIDAHVAECNISFEFKQALPSGSFDITLTGLTKLPVFRQQRTVMLGNSMLYCTLNPSGVFAITNNSGITIGVGYSTNVTFNYMFI